MWIVLLHLIVNLPYIIPNPLSRVNIISCKKRPLGAKSLQKAACAPPDQPFTAPAVMPEMMCFWQVR